MKVRAQKVKAKHLPDQWTANDILKVIAVGWWGGGVHREQKDERHSTGQPNPQNKYAGKTHSTLSMDTQTSHHIRKP